MEKDDRSFGGCQSPRVVEEAHEMTGTTTTVIVMDERCLPDESGYGPEGSSLSSSSIEHGGNNRHDQAENKKDDSKRKRRRRDMNDVSVDSQEEVSDNEDSDAGFDWQQEKARCTCRFCGKVFSTFGNARKHMKHSACGQKNKSSERGHAMKPTPAGRQRGAEPAAQERTLTGPGRRASAGPYLVAPRRGQTRGRCSLCGLMFDDIVDHYPTCYLKPSRGLEGTVGGEIGGLDPALEEEAIQGLKDFMYSVSGSGLSERSVEAYMQHFLRMAAYWRRSRFEEGISISPSTLLQVQSYLEAGGEGAAFGFAVPEPCGYVDGLEGQASRQMAVVSYLKFVDYLAFKLEECHFLPREDYAYLSTRLLVRRRAANKLLADIKKDASVGAKNVSFKRHRGGQQESSVGRWKKTPIAAERIVRQQQQGSRFEAKERDIFVIEDVDKTEEQEQMTDYIFGGMRQREEPTHEEFVSLVRAYKRSAGRRGLIEAISTLQRNIGRPLECLGGEHLDATLARDFLQLETLIWNGSRPNETKKVKLGEFAAARLVLCQQQTERQQEQQEPEQQESVSQQRKLYHVTVSDNKTRRSGGEAHLFLSMELHALIWEFVKHGRMVLFNSTDHEDPEGPLFPAGGGGAIQTRCLTSLMDLFLRLSSTEEGGKCRWRLLPMDFRRFRATWGLVHEDPVVQNMNPLAMGHSKGIARNSYFLKEHKAKALGRVTDAYSRELFPSPCKEGDGKDHNQAINELYPQQERSRKRRSEMSALRAQLALLEEEEARDTEAQDTEALEKD